MQAAPIEKHKLGERSAPLEFMLRTYDPRWDDAALHMLVEIKGDAFEAVYSGEVQAGGCS